MNLIRCAVFLIISTSIILSGCGSNKDTKNMYKIKKENKVEQPTQSIEKDDGTIITATIAEGAHTDKQLAKKEAVEINGIVYAIKSDDKNNNITEEQNNIEENSNNIGLDMLNLAIELSK